MKLARPFALVPAALGVIDIFRIITDYIQQVPLGTSATLYSVIAIVWFVVCFCGDALGYDVTTWKLRR